MAEPATAAPSCRAISKDETKSVYKSSSDAMLFRIDVQHFHGLLNLGTIFLLVALFSSQNESLFFFDHSVKLLSFIESSVSIQNVSADTLESKPAFPFGCTDLGSDSIISFRSLAFAPLASSFKLMMLSRIHASHRQL